MPIGVPPPEKAEILRRQDSAHLQMGEQNEQHPLWSNNLDFMQDDDGYYRDFVVSAKTPPFINNWDQFEKFKGTCSMCRGLGPKAEFCHTCCDLSNRYRANDNDPVDNKPQGEMFWNI